MSPKGNPKQPNDAKAKARSEAVRKVQEAEQKRGLKPGRGVGRRLHEGRAENA